MSMPNEYSRFVFQKNLRQVKCNKYQKMQKFKYIDQSVRYQDFWHVNVT